MLNESVEHLRVPSRHLHIAVDVLGELEQFGVRESDTALLLDRALDLQNDFWLFHSEHGRNESENGGPCRHNNVRPGHQINRIRLVRKERIRGADQYGGDGDQIHGGSSEVAFSRLGAQFQHLFTRRPGRMSRY